MRFEQLVQLVEVDNCRSLSQAAKQLYISQPSLSIAVNNLEQELGFKIFHRSNLGVTPTEQGKEVLRLARNVITEIEQMKAINTSNENIQGSLYLALTPVSANSLAPEIITAFYRIYPRVKLFIEECNLYDVVDLLKKGFCNIAFSGCNQNFSQAMFRMFESKNIAWEITHTSSFQLFVSSQNPLAQKNQVSTEEIATCTFIEYNGNGGNVLTALSGLVPARSITVQDRDVLKQFIAQDTGVAIFPDFFATNDVYVTHGLISALPIVDLDIKGLHYLMYNTDKPLSFLEKRLLEVLRDILHQRFM